MISQTAEYALRAIVFLGSTAGSSRTTQQIAEQTGVPAGYLSKVLQALGRAGLVEAQRGLYGGFVLSRALDELTILDVVSAVDPLKRIDRCPMGIAAGGHCLCPLHQHLDQGIAQLEALFRSTTIGALVAGQQPGQPFCQKTPRGASGPDP
jgi:Rrf2 family protein